MDSKVNWEVISHSYSKRTKLWKVKWQKTGKKRLKQHQRTKNYHFFQLPRDIARRYYMDGRLCSEFNPAMIKLRNYLNESSHEKQVKRRHSGVPIDTQFRKKGMYQASIPNFSPYFSKEDEEKMIRIEASQVHQAFPCKELKRNEIKTPCKPPHSPSTKRMKRDDQKKQAEKIVSQMSNDAVRKIVLELMMREGLGTRV